MKRYRVVALMHEDLIPPESTEGLSEEEKDRAEWWAEHDVVQALTRLGHDVHILGVTDDLMPLRRLVDGWKPHVVFNLLNELQDIGAYEVHVASYLELLNVPYTGCNSRGLMLARDKPLSKKIFRYHRIPNPAFAVLRKGASARSVRKLAFPLFVKSADEDASMGVSQASIVWDPKELEERAAFVHRKLGTSAIVEEYIEGRELTIGLLGNDRLQTFPIWELFFENLPEGTEPIATARVKWNPTYRKRLGITTGPAKLKPELAARIAHMAKRVYRHLELSGFARLDLRLTKEGLVYFIEANPNPDLSDDEEFAAGARKAGIGYDALIQRILNLGIRYRPPWKVE